MEDKDKEESVNELEYLYNRVKVYSSFEEQEEARLAYSASLTPVECIRQAVLLIRQVYGYDTSPPKNSKKIRVRKLG
jgi:hypothetical protein